ncbi:hypothetical protein GCK32_014956, partial [Trichostrongylus colubriformis]
ARGMDNFNALFNAFEERANNDNQCLFQLQRSNAVTQETIACLKEKIARYKQVENEQKMKRENAEHLRKELMEKLSTSLNCAKILQADFEKLSEQSAAQAKTDQELRAKMSELYARLSGIADMEKQLRGCLQNLKHPILVEPQVTAAIQDMRMKVLDNLKTRWAAFDLTTLIAEVQGLESQRQERLKISEELEGKSEHSAAHDGDNDMLREQSDRLKNENSNIGDERRKVQASHSVLYQQHFLTLPF